ncbi:hypothetical protein SAMN04489832_6686 [Micromonospora cremea]|uniref:Uncharacterized protein n=2 Tax=Micromonospora cremea TaxID=709881 RepID=A0A1N6B4F3_9ACTN|nr:hypothetical protein SAMN04489832_6686 [Micromonospora cremea]
MIVVAVILLLGLGYLLNWLAALLATSVVWPYRAVSSRWPVVAYPLDSSLVARDDQRGDRSHRRRVTGRAAALALTERWVRDIERQGHLEEGGRPAAPDGGASATGRGSR